MSRTRIPSLPPEWRSGGWGMSARGNAVCALHYGWRLQSPWFALDGRRYARHRKAAARQAKAAQVEVTPQLPAGLIAWLERATADATALLAALELALPEAVTDRRLRYTLEYGAEGLQIVMTVALEHWRLWSDGNRWILRMPRRSLGSREIASEQLGAIWSMLAEAAPHAISQDGPAQLMTQIDAILADTSAVMSN